MPSLGVAQSQTRLSTHTVGRTESDTTERLHFKESLTILPYEIMSFSFEFVKLLNLNRLCLSEAENRDVTFSILSTYNLMKTFECTQLKMGFCVLGL